MGLYSVPVLRFLTSWYYKYFMHMCVIIYISNCLRIDRILLWHWYLQLQFIVGYEDHFSGRVDLYYLSVSPVWWRPTLNEKWENLIQVSTDSENVHSVRNSSSHSPHNLWWYGSPSLVTYKNVQNDSGDKSGTLHKGTANIYTKINKVQNN